MAGPHLGERLAELRRGRGLTQEGLAARSGVSVDVVRRLEQRRKHGARVPTLRALARGLGVDVAALFAVPPPVPSPSPAGDAGAGAGPGFAGVVRHFMGVRGLSLRGAGEAAGYGASYLSKVLNGKKPVSLFMARRLDEALEAGGKIMEAASLSPPVPAVSSAGGSRPPRTSELVSESAMEAARLTMLAGSDLVDSLAIEQFYDETRRLSVIYSSSTAGIDREVLGKASLLRSALQKLAATYRKPSQSSDIYLMIGLLSGICSYACVDLGYPDAAMTQARASFMMGELAGHDGLRAWALGTRSLIARFQGRYPEALGYARQGLQYATGGTSLVRLRCGEGQTLAHMGDAASAVDCLDLARAARERVSSPDVVNGLFTFSEAKQTYYAGSSLQWLAGETHAKASESESLRAIRMFREAGPQAGSLADELLAHCYLANSRLTLGEVDGAIEALRPVLDLPLAERNSWQRMRVRQIASRLEAGKFSGSRAAISARDEISSFIEITAPGGAGPGTVPPEGRQ